MGEARALSSEPSGKPPPVLPPRVLPPRVGWFRRQFADIVYVARRDRKLWLLPLLFLLLMLASLMLIAVAAGPIAPFIYPFL